MLTNSVSGTRDSRGVTAGEIATSEETHTRTRGFAGSRAGFASAWSRLIQCRVPAATREDREMGPRQEREASDGPFGRVGAILQRLGHEVSVYLLGSPNGCMA